MDKGEAVGQILAQCELNIGVADLDIFTRGCLWRLMTRMLMFFFVLPTAQATLTLNTLTRELKSVTNWYLLGVELGLKRYQLTEIESNHRGDVRRCKAEVLSCWLDNTTAPTWKAVVEALDQMDEHRAAGEIRKKFITSTDPINTSEGI